MGAEILTYDTKLPKTAPDSKIESTYQEMRDHEAHMNGHGGYTGTLAEATGCEVRRDLSFATGMEFRRAVGDLAEKWGPALAVYVEDTKSFWLGGIFSS